MTRLWCHSGFAHDQPRDVREPAATCSLAVGLRSVPGNDPPYRSPRKSTVAVPRRRQTCECRQVFWPHCLHEFWPREEAVADRIWASGVAESCGLGQAVAGAAETVRGTLRVAGNGAGDSRAQRLGSGEHAAGGLAFGVDRTRASPWRLRQGPLEPLRGNVVGSFLDTLTVLPPRGAPAEQ